MVALSWLACGKRVLFENQQRMNYYPGRGGYSISRGRGGSGRSGRFSGRGSFVSRGGGRDVHSIAGRGGNNTANKWVREPNIRINGGEDESKGESSADGKLAQTGSSQEGGNTGNTEAAHPDKYKWERQSSKLSTNSSGNRTILEKSNDDGQSDFIKTDKETAATETHTTHKDDGKKNVQRKSSNIETQFTSLKNKSNSWKPSSSEFPVQPNVDNNIMKKSIESNTSIQTTPVVARSKAIFSKGDNSWKRQSTSEMEASYRKPPGGQNPISNHHRKRKHTATGPRRICLLTSTLSNENDNTDMTASADDTQQSPLARAQSPELKKTLTDFCYQDTGRGGRGTGRGRGRGIRGGRGGRSVARGNIGLVRVKTADPSSTPICPTFRRGMPCNNPKCKLRHDVSTEASRPICVFFQRNGMCSKGDECSFRHVKISWDAEICPTFQKMGYCEDANCLLKHVDAKKPRIEASSSTKRQPR